MISTTAVPLAASILKLRMSVLSCKSGTMRSPGLATEPSLLPFSKVWISRAWTSLGTRSAHCPPPRKDSAPAESLTMMRSESSVCTVAGSATISAAREPPTRPKPDGADRSKVVVALPPQPPSMAAPASSKGSASRRIPPRKIFGSVMN